VIVDITTTGSTLRANHLKVLSDGVILRSQACLVASRRERSAKDEATIAELAAALRAG
jgi:ATP phosphoribosyltransferase